MYKKILVPLDGSGLSECVLEHVKAVATGCRVPEVDLFFVITPSPVPWQAEEEGGAPEGLGPRRLTAEGEKRAEAWGKNYLGKIEKDLKAAGVAAKSVLVRGKFPEEEILNYASKNNVDLIIMATHGRSGPARWAFGSTSERVIRLATVPIMVVRPAGCVISA